MLCSFAHNFVCFVSWYPGEFSFERGFCAGLRHTSIMYKKNSRGRKTHRESQESRARGAWCVHELTKPHQRSTSSERSTE